MTQHLYIPSIHGQGPIAQAATPKQAIDLLAAIKSHPGQRRASFRMNPLLMRVAQARANDMAARDYFSHTDPDGYGPNYHVRQAGYPLPLWYGQKLDSNQVESLHAGGVDVAMVMDGWEKSPSHSVHVLGTLSFYNDQVDVGAGYAERKGTVYGKYWCFLSAMKGSTNG